MEYNAEENESEEKYFVYIHWLEQETANNLRAAKGDKVALTNAIKQYLETGYKSRLSAQEMVDFFCVSTPSILDMAGFSEKESEKAIKIYDKLNPKLFSHYYPNNK